MEKMQFPIKINAPREKVWQVLWNDDTYRKWTSAFHPGSYAESDWNEGSKILFLTPEGDGMHSVIAKKTPNEFISFQHLGEMKGGKEVPMNDKIKQWSGSLENYTLRDADGGTDLLVEMDIDDT